jgi:hypothetical protein
VDLKGPITVKTNIKTPELQAMSLFEVVKIKSPPSTEVIEAFDHT